MNNIEITEPKIGDEYGIATVHKDTWLNTYENDDFGITKEDILSRDFDSEKKLSRWRDTILNNGTGKNYLLVAKENDKIIAFCSGIKDGEHREISTVYVNPDYQGLGIGKKLTDKMTSWLGNNFDIKLRVIKYNSNAIAFYKKIGFIEVENSESNYTLTNGKNIPDIEMVYKIH